MVYNISRFEVVYKKKKIMFFETVCKLTVKRFVVFCVQGQPNLNTRIQDHSWTRFDATSPMAVLELVNELPLKFVFFNVSSIVLIYVKFQ